MLAANVDWTSVDGLIFAAAMFSEITECPIAFNHEINRASNVSLWITSGYDIGFGDSFGAKVGNELCLFSPDEPVCSAIWHWAAHSNNGDLVRALTAPETLEPTSAYRAFELI